MDNIDWIAVNVALLECALFLNSSKTSDVRLIDRYRILQERLITNKERTDDIADSIFQFQQELING